MSKLSAITIIPSESHSSICHVEGMLWAVRIASQPMSFSIFICLARASRSMAAPSGPRSWCRHTPFSLRVTPFSWNPCSLLTLTVRIPNFHSLLSKGRSPGMRPLPGPAPVSSCVSIAAMLMPAR